MLSPNNDNASDKRPAKTKATRPRSVISPAVKRDVMKAMANGESVASLAKRFNLKPATIYGFTYQHGKSLKRIKAQAGIAPVYKAEFKFKSDKLNKPKLTTDSENKLRDIAMFCEADKSEALNACVAFYYKHLREVVIQRIKA